MSVEMETKKLLIEGMTCGMCVKHVTHALAELDGVADVETNLEASTASVTFDPTAVGRPDFERAIADAGYELTDMV